MSDPTLPDGLSTGIKDVDAEHAVQVELVEAFRAAVAEGKGAADTSSILQRLLDFTDAHFLAEQLLMRLHSYPGYEAHRLEHDRLVDALRLLKEKHAAGVAEPTAEAAAALRDWLASHIQTLDQALGRYLAEQRETGS
jgi:hemerythrin